MMLALGLAVVLTACAAGGPGAPTAAEPTATPPAATATAGTVLPTVSAAEATAGTPATVPATEVPEASPVPAAVSAYLASSVVGAFRAAGLEAGTHEEVTKGTFGPELKTCPGVDFTLPSLGASSGGRVYACESPDALAHLAAVLESANATVRSAPWTVIVNEPRLVLVMLDGDLPADQATAYQGVVDRLR